jgi:hypothetical protein
MDLRVARDAVRSEARRHDVALVVTVLTFRLGVPGLKTEARVVASYVGDFGPIGFVVTGCALLPVEATLVRIFVTGNTVAAQPQVGRIPATVADVVTLRTAYGPMRAFQSPTRHAMIEARLASPRPANELGVPPEMLDVAAPTLLLLILGSTVKPFARSNAIS